MGKAIKSVAFFKDISDINNLGDLKVKSNQIFYSSNLGSLEEKDKDKLLDSYGIRTVIDLRTNDEIYGKPDLLDDRFNYVHIPIVDEKRNPSVTKETRNKVLTETIKQGGMFKHLVELYVYMVSEERSINQIRKVIGVLLNKKEDEAVIFHCTQGKDRTGIILATIYLLLGFDEEKIIKQYLKYNHDLLAFNFWVSVAMFLFISPRKAKNLRHALTAKKEYLQSAFNKMKEDNGVENFIKNKLRLDLSDLETFKSLYLIKNS